VGFGLLPLTLTSFVGRDDELSGLGTLLASDRLVTVTGPGGSGKTRLVVEVVRTLAQNRDGGVVFVDLGTVRSGVGLAVDRATGATSGPADEPLGASLRCIRDRSVVIVLDNCEHVLDEAARVAGVILAECPAAVMLATSREPLGVAGERRFVLGPLPVSGRDGAVGDAVKLFVERARRAAAHIELPSGDVLAGMCRQLDGLPLAIELVAAQLSAFSFDDIERFMAEWFALRSAGPRLGISRHSSVESSLTWSYRLLTDPEQQALRMLSVFRSPFRLDGAKAVITSAYPADEVMPLVASLVNKSLLVMTDPGRYRLLETVRAYVGRLLSERADEESRARDGHLYHFVALAERIGSVFEGPELTEWVTELRGDLADVRDAIDWASRHGHADEALELVGSLWRFWWAGASGEGLEAIRTALSIEGGQPANRARALVAAVLAASARFDFMSAVDFGQQAVAEADTAGDPAVRALARCWLGWMVATYDPQGARPHLAEAIELALSVADLTVLADARNAMAYTDINAGDLQDGVVALEEVLELTRRTGNRITRCHAVAALATAELMRGRLEAAWEATAEALPTAREVNDGVYMVLLFSAQAWIAGLQGCHEAAQEAATAATAAATATGNDLLISAADAAGGLATFYRGELNQARSLLEKSIPVLRLLTRHIAVEALCLLATISAAAGDRDRTQDHLADAAELAESSPQLWARGRALLARARFLLEAGELNDSASSAADAVTAATAIDDRLTMIDSLEIFARITAARGSSEVAGALEAAAIAARAEIGYAHSLGPPIEACEKENPASSDVLSLHEALQLAMSRRGQRGRPSSGWDSLTPAETRVVEFVADGLTNPEIARRLYVSRDTVKSHVSSALMKLALRTRAELAASASRRLGRVDR
jgi:predicted ATPase/DNA-binding CsgD family transcriptional regulator